MPISDDRLHQDTVSIRNEELRTLWLVNGFFSTINTALIGFLIIGNPTEIFTIAICFFWRNDLCVLVYIDRENMALVVILE